MLRVGCGWDNGWHRFRGPAAVVPPTCELAAVAHLRANFHGAIAVVWSFEGIRMRVGRGEVDPNTTLVADLYTRTDLPRGRWTVAVEDARGPTYADAGPELGAREFLVVDDGAEEIDNQFWEFFDFLE